MWTCVKPLCAHCITSFPQANVGRLTIPSLGVFHFPTFACGNGVTFWAHKGLTQVLTQRRWAVDFNCFIQDLTPQHMGALTVLYTQLYIEHILLAFSTTRVISTVFPNW